MQMGMVGLGRMGMNMVQRLIKAGHQCVGFDSNQATIDTLTKPAAPAPLRLETSSRSSPRRASSG